MDVLIPSMAALVLSVVSLGLAISTGYAERRWRREYEQRQEAWRRAYEASVPWGRVDEE